MEPKFKKVSWEMRGRSFMESKESGVRIQEVLFRLLNSLSLATDNWSLTTFLPPWPLNL
ncbi:MAG: hypothetical protein AB1611_21705 [bacterium]